MSSVNHASWGKFSLTRPVGLPMPVRIYTSAPARILLNDRPFGIVAWSEDASHHFGEAYVITYAHDGKPQQMGVQFPLVETDFANGIERQMRSHLEKLWVQSPTALGIPFEQLSEEIPVAEFAVSQVEKPTVGDLVREISRGTQCPDLSAALAIVRNSEQQL